MVRLGELLDLIDKNRESAEEICIMNNNGKIEIRGVIRSSFWAPHEDRIVESIQADHNALLVWLSEEENDK